MRNLAQRQSGSKQKRQLDLFTIVIYIIVTLGAVLILVPFYNVMIVSISPMVEYIRTPFLLFPEHPTLQSYVDLLSGGSIGVGYRTTLSIVALALPINLFLITLTAYALSKDAFPGKKLFIMYVLITMLFNGGIVPLYLVIKELNLMNTLWSVVLASGCNTFYLIITRNYFLSIPAALRESARIDGASEFTIFLCIILPLSLPILATIALFCLVDRWNEWYNPMLFLRRNDMKPLQIVLRNIVMQAQIATSGSGSGAADLAQALKPVKGMKMAAIILTMLPVMCVYPFLQKYFVKGLLIGAIKA